MLLPLELPEEITQFLGNQPQREAFEILVLDLLRRGEISFGKSAELLNIALQEMPALMLKHQIEWFRLNNNELTDELRPL